ncbi:hypothetical protein ACFXMT_22465 [Streptomyces mirabilis]|uniref:hypothetical protein n=1 Tax=Streptomyces mirabilis TaxID=68239 RepID=UPI00367E9C92
MHDAPADDPDSLAADDAEVFAYDPDDPTRLPQRRALWHIAVIGGPHEDDFDLALGYAQAADILSRYWIDLGSNDALPVPIYYNYRHAIELALKGNIRVAAVCLRRDGVTVPHEELDKFLTTSHAVEHLADRLNRYLGQLQLEAPNNRLDKTTQDTLDWLHQMDDKGQTFRYSRVKSGKGKGLVRARPHQQNIDFDADIRRLSAAAWMLYGGCGGLLDDYAENQSDFYAEMRAASY